MLCVFMDDSVFELIACFFQGKGRPVGVSIKLDERVSADQPLRHTSPARLLAARH
jgi:hypothetical protein